MIIKADLHMHTCLSPCGDDDMTPYNAVNLAKLLGYDMIAVTDHNSCLNCPAAVRAGEAAGLVVVPGMELCTAEEIHNVCLFPSLDAAKEFSDFVYDKMPDIINRPEIFGEQVITDEKDNIIGYEKRLLTVASDITEGETVKAVLVIRRRVLSGAYRQKLLQHFIGARHLSEDSDFQGGGLVAVCRRKKAFGGKSVPWQYEAFCKFRRAPSFGYPGAAKRA